MTINSRRLLAGLVLPLLSSFTDAISLSDFTPRNTDLSAQCSTAYSKTIPGCQASDFAGANNLCSDACINGLQSTQKNIQSKCSNDNVEETSMVGLFLLGQGIIVLCPNFQTSSSSSVVQATSTVSPSSSTFSSQVVVSSSVVNSPAPAPPAPPAAQTTPPPPASSQQAAATTNLAVDTTNAPSAPPPALVTFATSTTTSKAGKESQKSSSQKSNADSGGGSPFDVQATSGSGPTPHPPLLGLLATLLFVFAL